MRWVILLAGIQVPLFADTVQSIAPCDYVDLASPVPRRYHPHLHFRGFVRMVQEEHEEQAHPISPEQAAKLVSAKGRKAKNLEGDKFNPFDEVGRREIYGEVERHINQTKFTSEVDGVWKKIENKVDRNKGPEIYQELKARTREHLITQYALREAHIYHYQDAAARALRDMIEEKRPGMSEVGSPNLIPYFDREFEP